MVVVFGTPKVELFMVARVSPVLRIQKKTVSIPEKSGEGKSKRI
jgi:hypothetical protein